MKYIVKQKMISIGDDFSIIDETGREKFYVDGYGFSFGKKLAVLDENKNQVALIKKALFSFLPHFKIYVNGQRYATVSKAWLSFRPAFYIKRSDGAKIKINGRLLDFEYSFFNSGNLIAEVSKKWFTMTDTYAVEIPNNSDTVLLLSAAVIVDLVLHNKN